MKFVAMQKCKLYIFWPTEGTLQALNPLRSHKCQEKLLLFKWFKNMIYLFNEKVLPRPTAYSEYPWVTLEE